jgi:hypothetical protein
MSGWRASGGEPDTAPTLIQLLSETGFKLIEVRPLIFAVRPPGDAIVPGAAHA